jgi:hypothetical protein
MSLTELDSLRNRQTSLDAALVMEVDAGGATIPAGSSASSMKCSTATSSTATGRVRSSSSQVLGCRRIPGLCRRCAFWIDTETDRMRDVHLLDPFAGMDW